MDSVANAKWMVPHLVREQMRAAHRYLSFRRSFHRFKTEAASGVVAEHELEQLVYGWGNEGWSIDTDFAGECCRQALAAEGDVLECGSGLSTLLIGAMTAGRGIEVHTLEHSEPWALKVRAAVARWKLEHVKVHVAPLQDHQGFSWYEQPGGEDASRNFALVVCDGPPGDTPGGRYGLMPIMARRLLPGCMILLDDAGRPGEKAVMKQWSELVALDCEYQGSSKQYACITYRPDKEASLP